VDQFRDGRLVRSACASGNLFVEFGLAKTQLSHLSWVQEQWFGRVGDKVTANCRDTEHHCPLLTGRPQPRETRSSLQPNIGVGCATWQS